MIDLFDSLSHPTLTGRWIDGRESASFQRLRSSMREGGFSRACAVGLAGICGYEHEAFATACRKHDGLLPVAGLDPVADAPFDDTIPQLKDMGFIGIKVHPRFSGMATTLERLPAILRAAQAHDLVTFYCTYLHARVADCPQVDPFQTLLAALRGAPEAKVVLLHGGDVSLLRYAELVRFNPNLLLDVSFTLMKYRGSSLDQDLRFLFETFDERVCLGTDFPEYGHAEVRHRFEHMTADLPSEKRANVGAGNLTRFLEMT